jgi:hypothetical protein
MITATQNTEQACSRCGQFKPREEFKRRATPAQKKRWNKDWVNTSVCYTCSKPITNKRTLGPVGLLKKLTNMGLPQPIIDMRVAQRAHIHKTRRVAGLRKTWKEKNKETTAECLAALDREATMNRRRITYALNVGMASPLIAALMRYNEVLIATRVAIKENANAGRTPPNPWHDAIPKEQKLELIRIFTDAMQGIEYAYQRGYLGRAQPSWWSDFVLAESQRAVGAKQNKGE